VKCVDERELGPQTVDLLGLRQHGPGLDRQRSPNGDQRLIAWAKTAIAIDESTTPMRQAI
jgi:hypothetical protein